MGGNEKSSNRYPSIFSCHFFYSGRIDNQKKRLNHVVDPGVELEPENKVVL